jgi:phage-related protein
VAVLANLLVRISVDVDHLRRGLNRAQAQFQHFGQQSSNQLSRQFQQAGQQAGHHFSQSFHSSFSGQFGRFGHQAGQQFGQHFSQQFHNNANNSVFQTMMRFGGMGGQAGTQMGQNVAGGFASAGPGGMIAKVALALTLLPLAGAAAATGLVLAFGGAFAAIGLAATASNKGVKNKMTDLVTHVKSVTKKIAKPFVKTWNTILDTAKTTFDKLTPQLENAFKIIAPAVSRFVENLGKALQGFDFTQLATAFSGLLDAIGPQLPGIIDSISDALKDIADLVADNPDLFGELVSGLIKLIPLALQFITVLAKIYDKVSNVMGSINPLIVTLGLLVTPILLVMTVWNQFKDALDKAKPTLESIWQKVQEVFGKIWNKINLVMTVVKGIISSAFNFIQTIVQTVLDVVNAIINGDMDQVKAAIKAGVAAIKAAWHDLWTKVKAAVKAAWNFIKTKVHEGINKVKTAISNGIEAAKDKFHQGWNRIKAAVSNGIKSVTNKVRQIPGKIKNALGNLGGLLYEAGKNVVRGLINGIKSMFGALSSAASDLAGKIRSHLPFSPAKEGPLSGTGDPRRAGVKIATMLAAGMAQGTGAVTSAAASVAGAAGIGPRGIGTPAGVRAAARNTDANQPIIIRSDGTKTSDFLVELLREAIRNRGGNVQSTLGRG